VRVFQPGLLQQRLAEDVFLDLLHGAPPGLQLVMDGVAPLGDGDLVVGCNSLNCTRRPLTLMPLVLFKSRMYQ